MLSQGSGSDPPLSEAGAQEGAASWVGRPGVALLPSILTFHSFALTLRYECHLGPGPRPLRFAPESLGVAFSFCLCLHVHALPRALDLLQLPTFVW